MTSIGSSYRNHPIPSPAELGTITISPSPSESDTTDPITFQIHKHILKIHSPFFAAAFSGNFKEGKPQEISLTDMEPDIFGQFVDWLYYRQLLLPPTTPPTPKATQCIYRQMLTAYLACSSSKRAAQVLTRGSRELLGALEKRKEKAELQRLRFAVHYLLYLSLVCFEDVVDCVFEELPRDLFLALKRLAADVPLAHADAYFSR